MMAMPEPKIEAIVYAKTRIAMPEYEYDEVVEAPAVVRHEANNRAFSRLDQKYHAIEALLVELGRHGRQDGAPPDMISSQGKVSDRIPMGASQAGHPVDLNNEMALMDYCVCQLTDIVKKVFEVNYGAMYGRPIAVKRQYLRTHYRIRMSVDAWNTNLKRVRDETMLLRTTLIRTLRLVAKEKA